MKDRMGGIEGPMGRDQYPKPRRAPLPEEEFGKSTSSGSGITWEGDPVSEGAITDMVKSLEKDKKLREQARS